MFKKIVLLLTLAFSIASTVGAMTTPSQVPLPQPPTGSGN